MTTSEEYRGRFWSKVDGKGKTAEECWNWNGAMHTRGYGRFHWRTTRYAHHIAYELIIGPIPEGSELHHKCENTSCVNPYHLEPLMRMEHSRRRSSTMLTAEDVKEIHNKYAAGDISQRKLAAQYGVSLSTINQILQGQTWREFYPKP